MDKPTAFFIISGSDRKNSQSVRVAKYVASRIHELFRGSSEYLCDLASVDIPIWNEEVWTQGRNWNTAWSHILDKLHSTDALITICPEWGGMVPPRLKNFYLLCSQKELGHKPNLLVTVSAKRGGAYPVSEMRSSSYKNNKVCHIPEHVIVRNAADVLVGEHANSNEDKILRDRIDWSLQVLQAYSKALREVRSEPGVLRSEYKYGM